MKENISLIDIIPIVIISSLILAIIVFLLLTIIKLIIFKRGCFKSKEISNYSKNRECVNAKVLEKQCNPVKIGYHNKYMAYSDPRLAPIYKFYITFEIDYNKKQLEVPGEVYSRVSENTHGKLTYKGNKFISFDYSYETSSL